MSYLPRKPSGPPAFVALWERVFGGQFPLIDTETVKWSRSTKGYAANVQPAKAGKEKKEVVAVERFRLKQLLLDVLKCKPFDDEEADDVYIARPPKLRASYNNPRAIDGDKISYTYDATAENRVAYVNDVAVENQVIVPRYIIPYNGSALSISNFSGDEIFAVKFDSPIFSVTLEDESEVQIVYQDLNVDGRAWARAYGD